MHPTEITGLKIFVAAIQLSFNIIFATIKNLAKWCKICQHTQTEKHETDFMD